MLTLSGERLWEPHPEGKVWASAPRLSNGEVFAVRDKNWAEDDTRYRRHDCPRRGKLEELATIHHTYAEQDKAPEMLIASKAFGPLSEGDMVTVYDSGGNEVKATVRRSLVAVVPDWATYVNPDLEARQGTLS